MYLFGLIEREQIEMDRVWIFYLSVIGACDLTHSNFEWKYLWKMTVCAVEGGLGTHVLKFYLGLH